MNRVQLSSTQLLSSSPSSSVGPIKRTRFLASLAMSSIFSVAAMFSSGCDDSFIEPEPESPPGIDESDCAPNAARFRDVIDIPLLQQECIACHVRGGQAEGTRFVLTGGTTEEVSAVNMTTLFALASEMVGDVPLIVAKPTLRHPDGHGGGQVVTPGSVNEMRLQYIANWGAGAITDCTPPREIRPINCEQTPARGGRQLRRLTRDEYLATVRDLTGVNVDFVDIPLDQSESIFDSYASSLLVNDALAAKIARVSEGVGERLAANLTRVSPCGGNGGCRDDFLMEFGARAFRRPLTSAEFERYGDYFDLVEAQDGFAGAVRETVVAMLDSPNFLYRAELGEKVSSTEYELTGYEIASELSYLIIGSMPDDALLIAAARGDLDTAEGRASELARLLEDPRAEATVLRFVDQWLDTRGFAASANAGLASPAVLESMRVALEFEVLEAFRLGTPLSELLVRENVVVDQTLADFYGLSGAGQGMSYVDGGGLYGGLLRQGAVIVAHSRSESVAPILRGLLVRERFLCQELPPPPANAASMQEEIDVETGGTARAGSNARLEEATCKGCHQLMDPIGFGFSDYDLVGRHRTIDDSGAVPEVSGEIFKADDAAGAFSGAHGLAVQLAASREVGACVQQMWLRFAAGSDDPELECNVDDRMTSEDLNFFSSLSSIIDTPHFVERRGEDSERDGPAVESLPLVFDGVVYTPEAPGEPEPTPQPEPQPQPEPEPGPDPEGPIPAIPDVFPDGVRVTAYQNLPADDWGTGYCMRFRFEVDTYLGAWNMPIDVVGVINTSWNVARSGDSGTVTLSGEGFTADLGPGVYDDLLGYCADY